MLDPVTIATGIGALLKATYSIAVELKAFGDSIAIVQDKLNGLLQDVEALTLVLTSMRDTFDGITAGVGTGHIGNHWQNISRALDNGKETLDQLHSCLEEVNKSSKILDAPLKQLRLNLAADKLDLFRQHVQSYRDALQLSLQTVILWTQVSQKQSTDLILPSVNSLHEEVRRVASILNQRIETLHGMIASQMPKEPKENQRDSQWQDESQMVAMCILRDCVESAATVVSTASTRLGSDPDAEASVRSVDSELGDLFPRRSMVMLQRYVESRTAHEYGHGNSPPERRSLASVPPFESSSTDYPDSDDDLEVKMTTTLLYRARKILLTSIKVPKERSRAERYLKNYLSRISSTSSGAQSHKTIENRRLEVEAIDLLVSIYCSDLKWPEARSLLVKKMALKERFDAQDDTSLAADVLLLARVLLANHEYLEAHLNARRALKKYRKISHAEGSSESLQVLILICRSDKKEEEADAYEAFLTEEYPDDSVSSGIGIAITSDSNQATNPDIMVTPPSNKVVNGNGPGSGQNSSSTIDPPSTSQSPPSFSYDRQHNLSDVISNAKFAAKLSTSKAGILRNRKPKLIFRGGNERGPFTKLPPSPVKEEEEKEEEGGPQQQKPKLIPRGAAEREPIIELPPFPDEKEQPPKLVPRGAKEREPTLELPPFPGEERHLLWDSTRLWPRRRKSTKTANRMPYLPIEVKTPLGDESETNAQQMHSEGPLVNPRRSRTKSVDILAGRSLEQRIQSPSLQFAQEPDARLSLALADSKRNSSTSTIRSPQAPSLSSKQSKPTLSRLEVAARSTLYDDQWLRNNRAWLIALINYTETNATTQPKLDSTSDLLSGFSFSSRYVEHGLSRPNSIASSEALTPSLRLIHPALRPERSVETWV